MSRAKSGAKGVESWEQNEEQRQEKSRSRARTRDKRGAKSG